VKGSLSLLDSASSEFPEMLRRYWLAVASHRRSTHTNYLMLTC